MTFALDLQKFAEKAGRRADLVVGEMVEAVVTKIDTRSPVGDATYWKSPPPKGYVGGRFRGNWQLGIGAAPTGVLERIDPSGRGTVTANLAQIPENAAGLVYFYANNLPYAQRIENGWAYKAPTGVVGITVIEFQSMVDDAVASAKRQTP